MNSDPEKDLEAPMTEELRSLAAELDELADAEKERVPDIPDFRIVDVLGRGGMGTAYLAEQLSLGREVALKVVRRPKSGTAPLPPQDEARMVAQLHHPNIVQVYAAGEADGQSWFAMELLRGKTAKHGEFAGAEEVARLGVQIAEALAYAHRCGVVHRDVKPSNIFIGENGLAKLGDFGLANSSGDGGTRRYMAPEIADGGGASEASDQYALGVTLQELAGPGAPADFAAICDKAANANPANRYRNMYAMLDDLRRFLVHKPVAANPPSVLRRFRLFASRNPVAALGLVAAGVFLAGLVAALAVGYVQTSRALAATEREAASAAQSLAMVVTENDGTGPDRRTAEIVHALNAAENLAERFPENGEIADAVEKLKRARAARERFKERHGAGGRSQRRFRNVPRK